MVIFVFSFLFSICYAVFKLLCLSDKVSVNFTVYLLNHPDFAQCLDFIGAIWIMLFLFCILKLANRVFDQEQSIKNLCDKHSTEYIDEDKPNKTNK